MERRTKRDIVFEKTVKHVDVEVKYCDDCNTIIKGNFPADMPGSLQYGNGLKAYIIHVLVAQKSSLDWVQKMIKSILVDSISEASLLKFLFRFYQVLQGKDSAIQQIIERSARSVDETFLRVHPKNQWIGVYSGDDITLQFLPPKRGTEAIKERNIISPCSGTVIHDFGSPYLTCEHCIQGRCGGHLVRELSYGIASNGYNGALNIKTLLREIGKKVSKRKKLSEREYCELQKRYCITTHREKELLDVSGKPNGKRGQMHHRMLIIYGSVSEAMKLLYCDLLQVLFLNNRFERDLRMAKVQQKGFSCFRKELFAKAYCRMSSFLPKTESKGYNPLVVQVALDGKVL